MLTWMPYVLLGGLLLLVVRAISVPVSNGDTFFHLRYGHEFLDGWSLWHPGHVSSFGQQDWGLALALLTALVPFTSDRPAAVPGWLDPALDRLPPGTALQSTGPMGGYLLWRHPDLDPVLDGYTDAYTTRHLEDQTDIIELHRGWDRLLRKSGVQFALLPTRSQLGYALVTFEGWRVLHTSREVSMYQAPEGWSE